MTESAAAAGEGTVDTPELREALKRSASALKRDAVPFALGGSYALWVHGAPEPVHDVDLVVAESDIEAAVDSLSAAGFQIERPPEDWLFKAHADQAMVDVLHRLQGEVVDAELLRRAGEHEVLGLRMPVLPPTEIMAAKLASLSEHYCDFATLLPVVRAVREQLDWDRLRTTSRDRPFAEAFLLLVDRLGIQEVSV
ncbi:MAG: nucleotidyltransferase family protein, partial [Actinomycetes bacterium]